MTRIINEGIIFLIILLFTKKVMINMLCQAFKDPFVTPLSLSDSAGNWNPCEISSPNSWVVAPSSVIKNNRSYRPAVVKSITFQVVGLNTYLD